MITGLGTDIVEIKRLETNREALAERILTDAEAVLYRERGCKTEFLAGRWAAKEAFSKALGTGIGASCSFLEIEILPDENGCPKVSAARGTTAETLRKKGVLHVHVSISHERDYAVSTVILEG